MRIMAVLICLFVVGCAPQTHDTDITVGAVLPLSGPAVVWGENVRNGIELATAEKPHIKVVFEDSKGTAADGMISFQHVVGGDVDIVVSALSTVSVPLSQAANDQNVLLIALLSAADNITNNNTFRYYSTAKNFAEPSFIASDSPLQYSKRVAVLYRNDELGVSVMNNIRSLSENEGKQIVFAESFKPGEKDFAAQMLKVAASEAEVLFLVPVTPSEALAIVKAAQEQKIGIPLVEASAVYADPANRKELAPEVYANVYAFSLVGNSEDFKRRYMERFGKEPNFGAAFGYDAIMLLDRCTGEPLKQCLESQKSFNGITGTAVVIGEHDFNVPLQFAKIS